MRACAATARHRRSCWRGGSSRRRPAQGGHLKGSCAGSASPAAAAGRPSLSLHGPGGCPGAEHPCTRAHTPLTLTSLCFTLQRAAMSRCSRYLIQVVHTLVAHGPEELYCKGHAHLLAFPSQLDEPSCTRRACGQAVSHMAVRCTPEGAQDCVTELPGEEREGCRRHGGSPGACDLAAGGQQRCLSSRRRRGRQREPHLLRWASQLILLGSPNVDAGCNQHSCIACRMLEVANSMRNNQQLPHVPFREVAEDSRISG